MSAWKAPKVDQAEAEAAKKYASKEHIRTKAEVKSTLDSFISSEKASSVRGQLSEKRTLPNSFKKQASPFLFSLYCLVYYLVSFAV